MSLYQLFQALGLTVLHMLWIGTVIGGLAFVWLRSNPNADPRTRYACVVGGLMALLLATGFTFAFLASATPASTVVQTDAVVAATADVSRSSGEVLVRPRNVDTEAIGLERTPTVMIACAWLAGIALMSIRLFRQWVGVRRLRIIGVSEPSRKWTEMFDALKSKIGVRSRVSMLVSDIVDAPMVVGWLRPLVLVPATAFTSLTPDQLQTVLAHELQHIARRDHLVNMLQAFIEVLLFFHPVTWWLSRQIRVERENCCDDSALLVTGSPRTFAEALLALESLRVDHDKNDSPHLLTATGGLLMHRISRLFGSNQPRSLNAGWRAVSACTLLAVAGLTFGTAITDPIALAQDRGGSDARDIDLDELKAGIEARIEAMGEDLREQVANGEISEADAKARYAAAERRMWMRYRAAEEQNATRGKSEVDYEAAAERMTEMVKNGEITKEQMRQRLDRMTQAGSKEGAKVQGRTDLDELKAKIEERVRAMGIDLRKKVAAGEISEADARARFEEGEKRMWMRYRAAEEQNAARGKSKVDYDAAVERMTEMVKDGEITKEQMQQRLDRMKKAETRKDKNDDRRRMSRADYEAAVERMTKMVKNGEMTREQMQQRLDRMKKADSKDKKAGDRRRSRADYEAAVERMTEMVKNGEMTREQMQQRLDRMKQAESRRDKEDDR